MAAGGTTSNVQLGPGRLYVAPLGTSEPASATAALPSAWRVVGYTDAGSTFTANITNSPVEVAEEIDPILYFATRRENSLAFEMAETVRRNLALALGDMTGAFAANDGTAFEPPDPSSVTACMIVKDSAESPTDPLNERWLFRQCKPGGQVQIQSQKAPQKRLIAVTFNIEKPSGSAPFKVFPSATGLV